MKLHLPKIVFRKFREYEIRFHELNYLFWECTQRCNLKCLHCGSDCSANFSHPDMSLEDFLSALDTIPKKQQNLTIVLTGGEPLLRNDLEKCGKEIRKREMRWSLVTNGHLYTADRHNSLLNAGMGALTISLDGMQNSHNWLRKHQHSFQKVSNAIEIAAGSPRLNFDVVTCVHQKNIGELEQVRNFLMDKKVKSWRLFTITPIGRAENNPELILTNEQFRQLMKFIANARRTKQIDVKFSCEGFVGSYEKKVRDSRFFCRAGINIGSVLIDGSISACPNIDRSFSQGNIYTDNFNEIWQTRYVLFRNRIWTKTGQCANCSYYKDCLGNGLHNWHENKDDVLICHNRKIEQN